MDVSRCVVVFPVDVLQDDKPDNFSLGQNEENCVEVGEKTTCEKIALFRRWVWDAETGGNAEFRI